MKRKEFQDPGGAGDGRSLRSSRSKTVPPMEVVKLLDSRLEIVKMAGVGNARSCFGTRWERSLFSFLEARHGCGDSLVAG